VRLTTSPPLVSRLSRQCGIITISQLYRHPRPATEIVFPFFICRWWSYLTGSTPIGYAGLLCGELCFSYSDDVWSSQEIHLWASTPYYGDRFTSKCRWCSHLTGNTFASLHGLLQIYFYFYSSFTNSAPLHSLWEDKRRQDTRSYYAHISHIGEASRKQIKVSVDQTTANAPISTSYKYT
jgi:hypothetical protein